MWRSSIRARQRSADEHGQGGRCLERGGCGNHCAQPARADDAASYVDAAADTVRGGDAAGAHRTVAGRQTCDVASMERAGRGRPARRERCADDVDVPRALDAAVEHLAIDALKLLSLVAAGAIARYSWRVASAIVRTFVIGHMAWMTATIGMLLLDAPVRLCTSYGSSDQRETGIAMIALTVAGVAGAAVYALHLSRGSRARAH